MPRVLLVKLGAIGDVIMAIPAAHALHAAGFQIDWVCGRAVAPLLALYGWIHVIEADERTLLLGSKPQRLRAVLSLWRTLRSRSAAPSAPAPEPYDLVATLYYDARYKLLTLPIRARRKTALSHADRATQLLPGRHHTDEYARILLAHPDGETPTQLAPVPLPPHRLPANPLPRLSARSRVVLFPAGARNAMRDDALRRWPIENYTALAAALIDRGHDVVLAGGPDDLWASPFFASMQLVDLTAKLSLLETVALLASADLTVTHDTGPLHLAGLTSTPIVAIFGPTDPRGRLPQRANAVALWGGEGFACRPCYDGRNFAPCLHNGCMAQVTLAMVLTEIDALLAARREGRDLLPRIHVPPHTPLVPAAVLQRPS